MKQPLTPDFKETPWWWEAAAPLSGADIPAERPEQTEVLVIGAGYTGLNAARTMAQGGLTVTVLDKGAIGGGASSRNGGSVVAGVKKHFIKGGGDWGDQLMSEMRDAYRHFETVIAEEKIEGYTGQIGRVVGAHSAKAFEDLTQEATEIGNWFEGGAEVIPKERITDELATSYYHGGVLSHQSGGVHPALYHRGLVDACRALGVTILAETPALSWSGAPDNFTVKTPNGNIRAKRLVLATNGYTDDFSGWHKRRIVPIESHMIATEPLGADRLRELMPQMRVYGDTKRVPFYFRPDPWHERLLFGGRASFGRITPRQAAKVLNRFAHSVFPDLGDIAISHAWKGLVGFTFDFVPHIGEHRGVQYAMGCNGSGIVPLSWLGHKLGQKILDPQAEESCFAVKPFITRLGYTGNPWFLPTVGRVYQFQDWLDKRGD